VWNEAYCREVRHVDLAPVPTCLFWILAVAGYGTVSGVLFWMMPPPLRRAWGRRVAFGSVVVFGPPIRAHDPRAALWFCAMGFAVSSLSLLWMGKLPADMPSAQDPACRSHPQYAQVARRGRIVGVAIVVLTIALVVLTLIYVRGL
jgi:hypothetical protein